jgi:hypothetical protein
MLRYSTILFAPLLMLCLMAETANAAHAITVKILDAETNGPVPGATVTVSQPGMRTQTVTTDVNGACTILAQTGVTIDIAASLNSDFGRGHARRSYLVPSYAAVVNIPMQIRGGVRPGSMTFFAVDEETGAVINGAIFIVTKQGFGSYTTAGSSVTVNADSGTEVNVQVFKGGLNGYLPAEVNYLMQPGNSQVDILMTPTF